jgi:hypothetical protein
VGCWNAHFEKYLVVVGDRDHYYPENKNQPLSEIPRKGSFAGGTVWPVSWDEEAIRVQKRKRARAKAWRREAKEQQAIEIAWERSWQEEEQKTRELEAKKARELEAIKARELEAIDILIETIKTRELEAKHARELEAKKARQRRLNKEADEASKKRKFVLNSRAPLVDVVCGSAHPSFVRPRNDTGTWRHCACGRCVVCRT